MDFNYRCLTFFIDEEDWPAFVECRNEIANLLDGNQPIPAALIDRYILFLRDAEWIAKKETRKREKERIKKAISKMPSYLTDAVQYFANPAFKEGYIISGQTTKEYYTLNKIGAKSPTKKHVETLSYSTETLLQHCIWGYLSGAEGKSARQAIVRIKSLVDGYINSICSDADKAKLGSYKRMVITGYLVRLISGFEVLSPNKKGKFTNTDLYQGVRSHLR